MEGCLFRTDGSEKQPNYTIGLGECQNALAPGDSFPYNDKGDERIRTADRGFADPCLATWLRRPDIFIPQPAGFVKSGVFAVPVWKPDSLTLSPQRMPWRERWPADLLAEALAEVVHLLSPRAVYRLFPLQGLTPQGPLLAGRLLHSPQLGRAVPPAGRLVLAVYTIGPRLEVRCRRWNRQGQLLRAFLLDALGTVVLLELGDAFHRHLAAQLARRGFALGCPFSPGEDDWPLEDQRLLFALLRPERIGVRLNERGVMEPLKSVSEAIPVGKEGEILPSGPACARCSRWESCPYRLEAPRSA